ncbi:MAG: DUF4388 domain-containing protein [Deltaproteobacteria bacterium]|nr:DUF4388 domain-containing protein [Deltaproteobacteria bacterium]
MSLVGNLEDLSLGDLLQIVSLSQKSGVLVLGSTGGAGQIVFRSGLVHAAGIKGRTPDLRSLLIAAGLLDAARFDAVQAAVGPRTALAPEQLVERAGLDPDQVDAAIRKTAEAAIFEMFAWDSGEFSFDARRDGETEEPYPCLRGGINAQYLAMEGMRLRDEHARVASPTPAPGPEKDDELFFGAEPLEVDGDEELELDQIWESEPSPPTSIATPADPAPEAEAEADAQTEPETVADSAQRAVQVVAERVVSLEDLEEPSDPEPAVASGSNRPVVVIDPDAAALEWVKRTLEGRFARIHVFQRAEEGLARIRQYLIRGEVPIVLISPAAPIDPLSGIHGLSDFVKRLRTQAARIVVVGLREAVEGQPAAVPSHLDAVVHRPRREMLRPGATADPAAMGERLLAGLTELLARPERGKTGSRGEPSAPAPASAPLVARAAEGELALASVRSQNEVLSILLDVAASGFERVAVLALRDGEAFAVAGRGIETLEVDPLASSPRLACPVPDTSLLRRVIDSKRSQTGALRSQADRLLVALFGPIEPRTAYLAPILGPAGAVAVLYADQGAQRRPIPDTGALERLIEQAGEKLRTLAIERAKGEAGPGAS